MGKKDRRFPRYQVELPVLLKDKRYTQEMVTGDVSRHGVFLRSDNPKPLPFPPFPKYTHTLPASACAES